MEKERLLVKRAKRGDTEAFASLYSEVYQDMYRFAFYTLGNREDSKDAVSEAVLSAFSSIKNLRKEEAFRSWIFRILFVKCKERRREYANQTLELDEAALNTAFLEGPEEHTLVRKAFFELDQEERLLIGMHLFCGYKSREIAELLHMNENTVRSKESRALKKMGQMLNGEEG